MISLKRKNGRFTLDARAALQRIVGAATLPHVSFPGSDDEILPAIVAPHRTAFLSALLHSWSLKRRPLLASSEQILNRSQTRISKSRFSSSAPELHSTIWTPEEKLCLVLTSGSTGQPQTFKKTARQLFTEAITLAELLNLGPSDTVLATTASHHVYGLLFGVLAPWASGAAVVASSENEPASFHPEKIAKLVAQHQATVLVTVPAHLRALLEAKASLTPLRRVISSAAPLDIEDARAFENHYGVEVSDVLGSTETGGIALRRPAQSVAWTPLPGVSVSLNEDELLVVTSPFLPDPKTPFVSDERAAIGPDGSFEYLGRSDGVVKVGGKRISLKEIETIAQSAPEVTSALALSRPVSGLRGEEILLIVAGDQLDKVSIKQFLRQHLEGVFVPRKIRVVSSLPIDERGKVQRATALALFDPAPPTLVEKTFQLPSDSRRFSGHFHADPLLPAVAQLTDLVLPEIRKVYGGTALVELRRVKWTRPLRPGTTVTLRLQPKKNAIHFELLEGELPACSGSAKLEQQ